MMADFYPEVLIVVFAVSFWLFRRFTTPNIFAVLLFSAAIAYVVSKIWYAVFKLLPAAHIAPSLERHFLYNQLGTAAIIGAGLVICGIWVAHRYGPRAET